VKDSIIAIIIDIKSMRDEIKKNISDLFRQEVKNMHKRERLHT
jgi:hypothetical protein